MLRGFRMRLRPSMGYSMYLVVGCIVWCSGRSLRILWPEYHTIQPTTRYRAASVHGVHNSPRTIDSVHSILLQIHRFTGPHPDSLFCFFLRFLRQPAMRPPVSPIIMIAAIECSAVFRGVSGAFGPAGHSEKVAISVREFAHGISTRQRK